MKMPDRIPYYKPPTLQGRDRKKAERDAFYSSKRWMKVRATYLWEHPLCVKCGQPAGIVHHKIERLVRPDLAWDEGNFEALCSPCHSRHHRTQPKGRG